MKILVLATDYPRPDGHISLQYIHSRNRWYITKDENIDVSVLSFGTSNDYTLDGIKVFALNTYEKKIDELEFDILVSHAPNLRNHYRFLKKHGNRFKNIVFFFHGHEVLQCSKIYPKPYDYMKTLSGSLKIKKIHDLIKLSFIVSNLYDLLKLKVWKKYFEKIAHKSHFVFVSNWMYEMFIKFVQLDPKIIESKKHIIYNCIGEQFEISSFNSSIEKKYDFITIRNNLDDSKYSIDIVTGIAENNPKYKFCVIGKGKFYQYNKKPDNLEWIDKNLSHEEIISFLNQSRCALIPTRADAQGVMACEMATFGIPVITSSIDVCKEVFANFNNVGFIDNNPKIDIEFLFEALVASSSKHKNDEYFAANTIEKELDLFKYLKGNR